ncbi:hypothetical protein STPH1_3374 [Streptomyces sp. OM5714]|nr:hypothetical protein STPH1_3374 [Streptomyces sp. OM5714]
MFPVTKRSGAPRQHRRSTVPHYPAHSHAENCLRCDTPLTGRSERWCSNACRQAAYRASKRPTVEHKTCTACGAPFRPARPGQEVCAYSREADLYCKAVQDEQYEDAIDEREAKMNADCQWCLKPTGWAGVGRVRKYCSDRCKVAAHRARKALK